MAMGEQQMKSVPYAGILKHFTAKQLDLAHKLVMLPPPPWCRDRHIFLFGVDRLSGAEAAIDALLEIADDLPYRPDYEEVCLWAYHALRAKQELSRIVANQPSRVRRMVRTKWPTQQTKISRTKWPSERR